MAWLGLLLVLFWGGFSVGQNGGKIWKLGSADALLGQAGLVDERRRRRSVRGSVVCSS